MVIKKSEIESFDKVATWAKNEILTKDKKETTPMSMDMAKVKYHHALFCASALKILDKRLGNGKETKFGKYISFIHERECKFSFVLNTMIENEIFEKIWSSHSGIYVQTNLICKKLVRPFIEDRLDDLRLDYELDKELYEYLSESYRIMPDGALEENFVNLIVETDRLAKDERVGKMFDEIVEAYVGTATEVIGERNGD